MNYIVNLLPYVIAGIITAFWILRLYKQGKVKNKILAVIGLFFAWLAILKIASELILKTVTPEGLILQLVIAVIGALIFAFLGVRRKSENNASPGATT